MPQTRERRPFEIYRGADALDYGEHGVQEIVDPSPVVLSAFGQFGGLAAKVDALRRGLGIA